MTFYAKIESIFDNVRKKNFRVIDFNKVSEQL